MKITGNESAYPIISEEVQSVYTDQPATLIECLSQGLTIRQHFAGLAMQGLLANSSLTTHKASYKLLAEKSIGTADALIAKLNKEDE